MTITGMTGANLSGTFNLAFESGEACTARSARTSATPSSRRSRGRPAEPRGPHPRLNVPRFTNRRRPSCPTYCPFSTTTFPRDRTWRRRADHLAPLEGRVVDPHVQRLLAEHVALLGVPHEEVGVGADGDRALPRVEAEDLRGRGRRDLDEAVHRDPPRAHAAVPQQVEPRLDRPASRSGSSRTSLFPSSFCPFMQNGQWSVETTWRSCVRRPRHRSSCIDARAERRRADVLRPLEAGPREVVLREKRYCGQVSANVGRPRSRASTTCFERALGARGAPCTPARRPSPRGRSRGGSPRPRRSAGA